MTEDNVLLLDVMSELKHKLHLLYGDKLNEVVMKGRLLHFGLIPHFSDEQLNIKNDEVISTYHVCPSSQLDNILTYGIFHDESPTLTLSLHASVLAAYNYHYCKNRPSCILEISMKGYDLQFVSYDVMGPSFLPKTTVNKEYAFNKLPTYLQDRFFKNGENIAWWVQPHCIIKVLHQTDSNWLPF